MSDQTTPETEVPVEATDAPAAVETESTQSAVETVVEAPADTTDSPAEPVVAEAAPVDTPAAPQQTETAGAAEVVAAVVAATTIVEPEVVETAPAVEMTAFQKKIAEVLAKGTVEQVSLITKLNAYLEEMKPGKPMIGDVGVIHQHQLWRTIYTTIESAPADQFKSLWSILLAFFHEYADEVFHESYVYRFSEHWKHSKNELDGFQRIVNLIKVSANPKTRGETTKQVDLDKTLAQPFSEEGRNRLINFYKK